MPRGRQSNYDKRITELIDQLRDAIIAREKAEMDARVAAQVGALVMSFGGGRIVGLGGATAKVANPDRPAAISKRPKRRPMSAAARRAVGERMRKFWADRRKQKAGN